MRWLYLNNNWTFDWKMLNVLNICFYFRIPLLFLTEIVVLFASSSRHGIVKRRGRKKMRERSKPLASSEWKFWWTINKSRSFLLFKLFVGNISFLFIAFNAMIFFKSIPIIHTNGPIFYWNCKYCRNRFDCANVCDMVKMLVFRVHI